MLNRRPNSWLSSIIKLIRVILGSIPQSRYYKLEYYVLNHGFAGPVNIIHYVPGGVFIINKNENALLVFKWWATP
jgi:hypothetical protein